MPLRKIVCLILLAQFISYASASAGLVVVLANSIDGSAAGGLYSFLSSSGFQAVSVNSTEFPGLRNSTLVIILGGQNAPEGVGEFSGKILSSDDQEYLESSNASRGLYYGNDVWALGQQVFVFAGYDEAGTMAAWKDNKNRFASEAGIQAPQSSGLRIQVSGVTPCNSVKFNEIFFSIASENATQAAWGVNNPDEYVSLQCDESEVNNLVIFERKAGGSNYARNDFMHKTIEGDYRLKVACDRDIASWVADIADCSQVMINITLPRDCGYCVFNPAGVNAGVKNPAEVSPDVYISSPKEGDSVSVWNKGVGFIANISNNGTLDMDNVKLNAITSSGKILETNYNFFSVGANQTKQILVRVNAQQVVENDSIVLWLDGAANTTIRVDRHVMETVPLYCSFCSGKH